MSPDAAITLRPAATADRPFLIQVYAESRADELAATDWTTKQKADFCQSQFEAQDSHYREYNYAARKLHARLTGIPHPRGWRQGGELPWSLGVRR